MALIYIVEDDESIREIETIALKNSNYIVSAFENAKEFYIRLLQRSVLFVIRPHLAMHLCLLYGHRNTDLLSSSGNENLLTIFHPLHSALQNFL